METRLERIVNLAEGRRFGREEGRVEGREEGRAEAGRRAIQRMCRSLGVELNAERLDQLARWAMPSSRRCRIGSSSTAPA